MLTTKVHLGTNRVSEKIKEEVENVNEDELREREA